MHLVGSGAAGTEDRNEDAAREILALVAKCKTELSCQPSSTLQRAVAQYDISQHASVVYKAERRLARERQRHFAALRAAEAGLDAWERAEKAAEDEIKTAEKDGDEALQRVDCSELERVFRAKEVAEQRLAEITNTIRAGRARYKKIIASAAPASASRYSNDIGSNVDLCCERELRENGCGEGGNGLGGNDIGASDEDSRADSYVEDADQVLAHPFTCKNSSSFFCLKTCSIHNCMAS